MRKLVVAALAACAAIAVPAFAAATKHEAKLSGS